MVSDGWSQRGGHRFHWLSSQRMEALGGVLVLGLNALAGDILVRASSNSFSYCCLASSINLTEILYNRLSPLRHFLVTRGKWCRTPKLHTTTSKKSSGSSFRDVNGKWNFVATECFSTRMS